MCLKKQTNPVLFLAKVGNAINAGIFTEVQLIYD
jgi:hypothetical protein